MSWGRRGRGYIHLDSEFFKASVTNVHFASFSRHELPSLSQRLEGNCELLAKDGTTQTITPSRAAHIRSAGRTRSAQSCDPASSPDTGTHRPHARSSRAPGSAVAPAACHPSPNG